MYPREENKKMKNKHFVAGSQTKSDPYKKKSKSTAAAKKSLQDPNKTARTSREPRFLPSFIGIWRNIRHRQGHRPSKPFM
jgi:hypothetical protein